MKAMILAAGYGTRLAQASGLTPKPLVEAGGRPMIAWAIEVLVEAGCTELVINLHHRAQLIEDYLTQRELRIPVRTIFESEILGTGGGVLNARILLDEEEPFILYNADIVTRQDLRAIVTAHTQSGAFATLMVNRRETTRALLFDDALRLLGKEQWKEEGVQYPEDALRRGFCGIHVISPALFDLDYPPGFSDIFDIYRRALQQGKKLYAFESAEYWSDLGTPARIAAFDEWLERNPSRRG